MRETETVAYHTLVAAGHGELADAVATYLGEGLALLDRLAEAEDTFKALQDKYYEGEESTEKRNAARAAGSAWTACTTLSSAIRTNGQGLRRPFSAAK